MKNLICIIAGEPNSINSEIIGKVLKIKKKFNRQNFFIIGNYKLIKKQFNQLKYNIKLKKIKKIENNNFAKNNFVLDVPLTFKNPFKVSIKNKKSYIINCFKIAIDLAKKKKVAGFINCPINKDIFKKKIGVTEYIGEKNKCRKKEVMLIYNNLFSVSPITTHINIKDVIKELKPQKIINKIYTINKFYSQKFKKKAKIGLLGLNPHNDEMRTNSFERKILIPLVKKLKKRGLKIQGPLSVDNVFLKKKIEYDVVVGMYHDQVLGPFKAINKFNGINVTLGLKYLRISPDHGTAGELIFKKKANPNSLIECINFF